MLSKFFLVCAIIVFTCIFGLAIVNAAIGCGQTVYHDNGTWETLDCLYIPYETKTGFWR